MAKNVDRHRNDDPPRDGHESEEAWKALDGMWREDVDQPGRYEANPKAAQESRERSQGREWTDAAAGVPGVLSRDSPIVGLATARST